MKLIFVDRRKTDKNKSAPNRQKLVRRIKKNIKASMPQTIGSNSSGVAGTPNDSGSPVKVAADTLREPYFRYKSYGNEQVIVIGNDEYVRGDILPSDEGSDGDGTGAGGGGEAGEDDFIVNVARDEFLDLFFEDCELPNLIKNKFTEKLENKFERAGFSVSGTPSQLSIIRTYKQALGRRKAAVKHIVQEIEELEKQLLDFDADGDRDQMLLILHQLDVLKNRKRVFDNYDSSDMRYRRREAKPIKTVDAVLIMVMDVSGSMDEKMKTVARRWFALLYAFIKRKYSTTELVFIAHTHEAVEMSENDFFSTRINGGTMVSPAIHLVNKIIKERYDPNETNIYVCHASDGDNFESDNAVVNEMTGSDGLLNKIQMFTYVEIQGSYFGNTLAGNESSLWNSYNSIASAKMQATKLSSADDCYGKFKELFKAK